MGADKSVRNAAICAMYRGGASLSECGAFFGLTHARIQQILIGCGVERREQAAATKANWQDPAFRERKAAAVKASVSVWPDCPDDKIADYATLRCYMSAREARASLDPVYAAQLLTEPVGVAAGERHNGAPGHAGSSFHGGQK